MPDSCSHDHKVVQVTNSTTWTSLGSCGNRRRAYIRDGNWVVVPNSNSVHIINSIKSFKYILYKGDLVELEIYLNEIEFTKIMVFFYFFYQGEEI